MFDDILTGVSGLIGTGAAIFGQVQAEKVAKEQRKAAEAAAEAAAAQARAQASLLPSAVAGTSPWIVGALALAAGVGLILLLRR